jgi:glycosyltransferase involved in cell wall biosynthesis
MRRNLRVKRQTLASADAVIAVSSAIARDLRARAPELAMTTIHTIPNPIDMAALDEAYARAVAPLDTPYVLYAGKLATNKGAHFLVSAFQKTGLHCPLVIVGDGPLHHQIAAEARTAAVDLRVLGWRDRAEVWAWMRHAQVLMFPSYGPESLSRVLLEAAALGAPIAAMDTGGTRDIIRHGETGLLSTTPDELARDVARLFHHETLRTAFGAAARADVHVRFAADSVVARVEQVYRSLLLPDAA